MMDSITQKNNFTIELDDSKYGIIKLFLIIQEKLYAIIQEINEVKYVFSLSTANSSVNKAFEKYKKFYKKIKIDKSHRIVDCETIKNKCILIFLEDEIFLTPLVDLSQID